MITGLVLVLALLSGSAPRSFEALPKSGAAPKDFVPAGWVIESSHEGDLTKDGVPDLVLVLLHEKGEAPPDGNLGERGLVALAREKGKLRLLGSNRRLLLCKGCGGMRDGDAVPTVNVEKGVLVVSNTWGANVTSLRLLRFRLDGKTGRLVLIGEDTEEDDSDTGGYAKQSSNYLTGSGIEEKSPDGDPQHAVKNAIRVEKRLVPIEAVQ